MARERKRPDPVPSREVDIDSDELDFHRGAVLYQLANKYNRLTLTLVETAQNAIDADATTVFIGYDMRRRTAIILDDGLGITRDKFRKALKSVGKTVKRPDKLGRFGLGMISPLNKCWRFIMASMPLGEPTGSQWIFVGEDIKAQHHEVHIPVTAIRTLPKPQKQFLPEVNRLNASWRTAVLLEKITDNKAVSRVDIDDLESHIRTKLRRGMRAKNTTIYAVIIDEHGQMVTRVIDASMPTGEPLPVVEYADKSSCGRIVFELYVAERRRGKRQGAVEVMRLNDNTAIQWREFYVQAMGSGWLKDVKIAFDALGSGFFEGTISIENVELDSERAKFALSDAVFGSYVLIYQWFLEHGQTRFLEEKTASRDQRYQQLGERALQRLFDTLENNPAFQSLMDGLAGKLPGIVRGSPEQPPPEPRDPEEPTTRRRQPTIAKRPPREGRRNPGDPPSPRDEPTGVSIDFAHETLPGSTHLWEFDPRAGLITFNIRHPTWLALDEVKGKPTPKTDEQIMWLQQVTAFEVLSAYSQVEEVGELELVRREIDQKIEFLAAVTFPQNK